MKIRILIVDDESRWLEFAQSDLSRFDIVVARSVEQAIKELGDKRFDLVIASSRYLHVLEVISKKYSDEQVVVTTIQPTTQEALQAYRLGAVRYFPKSFGPKDLFNRIWEVVSAAAGT